MALGDSIIDEDAIRERIIKPFLQQLAEQTIPTLQKALDESIDRAVTQLSNVLRGGTESVQAITDKLIIDAGDLLAAQDGWELDIEVPTIHAKIKLTKPK